jgi:hypothetical protein
MAIAGERPAMETADLEALATLTQLGAAVTLLFLAAWRIRGARR